MSLDLLSHRVVIFPISVRPSLDVVMMHWTPKALLLEAQNVGT
jgi:hypothetical protein